MRKSLLVFQTRYDTNVAVYTAINEGSRLHGNLENGKNSLYKALISNVHAVQ